MVGTRDALTMIEAGADQIPEATLLEAFELAHAEIVRICDAIDELRAAAGKPKWVDPELNADLAASHGPAIRSRIAEVGPARRGRHRRRAARGDRAVDLDGLHRGGHRPRDADPQRPCRRCSSWSVLAAVEAAVRAQFEAELRAFTDAEQDSKELKSRKRDILLTRIQDEIELPFPAAPAPAEGEPAVKDAVTRSAVKKAADAIYKDIVRKKIAVEKRRPDGRGTEEIRPITTEVGVSPRTHGSALFTRGQTQIMTLCTLGTAKEQQRIDDLSLESERRFMHHYNFPPYSVGETGFMRGPKRRDIGHGALAQRALEAVIPGPEGFPYTIRLVSETLESNGSSSMGSVCGSTMALMHAGRADRGARLGHRDGPRQGGRRLRRS